MRTTGNLLHAFISLVTDLGYILPLAVLEYAFEWEIDSKTDF